MCPGTHMLRAGAGGLRGGRWACPGTWVLRAGAGGLWGGQRVHLGTRVLRAGAGRLCVHCGAGGGTGLGQGGCRERMRACPLLQPPNPSRALCSDAGSPWAVDLMVPGGQACKGVVTAAVKLSGCRGAGRGWLPERRRRAALLHFLPAWPGPSRYRLPERGCS